MSGIYMTCSTIYKSGGNVYHLWAPGWSLSPLIVVKIVIPRVLCITLLPWQASPFQDFIQSFYDQALRVSQHSQVLHPLTFLLFVLFKASPFSSPSSLSSRLALPPSIVGFGDAEVDADIQDVINYVALSSYSTSGFLGIDNQVLEALDIPCPGFQGVVCSAAGFGV